MSRIKHESSKATTNWLAVLVAVVSLGTQIAVVAVWGGRTDAASANTREIVDRHEKRLTEVEKNDARQDTAIAKDQGASKVAYEDVIRRLASIEQKVDGLNQRR